MSHTTNKFVKGDDNPVIVMGDGQATDRQRPGRRHLCFVIGRYWGWLPTRRPIPTCFLFVFYIIGDDWARVGTGLTIFYETISNQ